MDEYIKRDGVLSKFNIDDMMNVNGTLISLQDARETISNFPAADVAPIRYACWKPVHASEATGWDPKLAGSDPIWGYVCTNCRNEAIFDCNDEYILSDYCPNCGANMNGRRMESGEDETEELG
jgi:hypothetical protein